MAKVSVNQTMHAQVHALRSICEEKTLFLYSFKNYKQLQINAQDFELLHVI